MTKSINTDVAKSRSVHFDQNLQLFKTYKGPTAPYPSKNHFVKKEHCFQSNLITTSYQEFSLLERKVWLHCINQIERNPISNSLNQVFEIPAKELNSNYSRLASLCDTITSKKIHSINKNGFGVIVPFPEARYYKRKGIAYISITMLSTVVPYFVDLQKAYTKFNLDLMLSIKTVYAQRLFEIIMMETNGRKHNVFNYDLILLQNMLGCCYDNFADFKRRVLEPSKIDIKDKTGYEIEYYEIGKYGRKVSEVQIMVFPKGKIDVDRIKDEIYEYSVQDEKGIVSYCFRILDRYEFGIRQRKKIMGDIKLIRKFLLIHARIEDGDIQIKVDATSYMAQSLGFGEAKGFLRNRKK